MKKTMKLFGVIAFVALIAFLMAACDNGSKGGGNQVGETSATYENTKDGTTYKLTVTQSAGRAAYVPAKGNTYVLLIITGTGTKTSRGTVSSISNGVFTLKPSNAAATFDVTTSGNAIVIIIGPITLEGSGGIVQGPGDLQSGGNPTNPNIPVNPSNPVNPVNPVGPANPSNPAGPGNSGDFDYVIYGGSVTITNYKGAGGNVTIPAAIEGKPVTSIGAMAFVGHGSTSLSPITSVTIPNSVTIIQEMAFMGCHSLTSVTIGSGVTHIGDLAFGACERLTSVTIGSGVTSIGNLAFSGCTSLTSVTIPDSVNTIRESAFVGCTSLASVTIPNSVTRIGWSAFKYCNLTSVTIPNSVTHILIDAFSGCKNLTSVTFQGTIAYGRLYDSAFEGDLSYKFYATDKDNGTPGTYTTKAPVNSNSVWTRQ